MLPEASVVFSFSSDGLSWSLLGCSSSEHGTNLDSRSSCCTERLKLGVQSVRLRRFEEWTR